MGSSPVASTKNNGESVDCPLFFILVMRFVENTDYRGGTRGATINTVGKNTKMDGATTPCRGSAKRKQQIPVASTIINLSIYTKTRLQKRNRVFNLTLQKIRRKLYQKYAQSQ